MNQIRLREAMEGEDAEGCTGQTDATEHKTDARDPDQRTV